LTSGHGRSGTSPRSPARQASLTAPSSPVIAFPPLPGSVTTGFAIGRRQGDPITALDETTGNTAVGAIFSEAMVTETAMAVADA